MNNFTFYSPTLFAFGDGEEKNTGALVRRFGGTNVLLVTGGGPVRRNGAYDAVAASLNEAGIPHYTGADSFVAAGAFATCGINYTELGTYTADMAMDILLGGAVPEFHVMDGGIITVNTETAATLGIDYSAFASMANTVVEVKTGE